MPAVSPAAPPADADAVLSGDPAPGPKVRCLLVGDARVGPGRLRHWGAQSRYEIDVIEARGLADAQARLAGGVADVMVLGADLAEHDGGATLTAAARAHKVPTIVLAGAPSDEAALRARRWGAADYLAEHDVDAGRFDEAIERALSRSTALPEDQLARISNLSAENEALRRTALRNMRLLKAQVMPVLSFAWTSLKADAGARGDGAGQAGKLARLTRNIVALIDDTVVNSAAFRINEQPVAVDLNEIVEDIVADPSNGLSVGAAHVRVQALPVLTARHSHMAMLFEELLLTAVRAAPLGHMPDLTLSAGRDPDGNPVIVLTENGLKLSARKQALAQRHADLADLPGDLARDEHSWSLCQRLVQKNDGELRIHYLPDGGCKVQIRFPAAMLAARQPARTPCADRGQGSEIA